VVSFNHARAILILVRARIADESKSVKLQSLPQGLEGNNAEEEVQQAGLAEGSPPRNWRGSAWVVQSRPQPRLTISASISQLFSDQIKFFMPFGP
jgi:hypothetical protein